MLYVFKVRARQDEQQRHNAPRHMLGAQALARVDRPPHVIPRERLCTMKKRYKQLAALHKRLEKTLLEEHKLALAAGARIVLPDFLGKTFAAAGFKECQRRMLILERTAARRGPCGLERIAR